MPVLRPVLPGALFLVAAFSSAACGGRVAPSSGSSLASDDEKNGADSKDPSSPDAPGTPTHWGWLSVNTSMWAEQDGVSVSAHAWFGHTSRTPSELPAPGCAVKKPSKATSAPATIGSSAGDVTIMVGANAPTALSIPWNADEEHYSLVSVTRPTAPLSALAYRASGGAVPAFDGKAALVTMPTILAPAPNAVVGSEDLDVSWSADEDADVVINVLFGWQRVECATRGPGHMIVPSALLQEAKELDQAEFGRRHDATLTVAAHRASEQNAGSWAIEVHDTTYRGIPLTRD